MVSRDQGRGSRRAVQVSEGPFRFCSFLLPHQWRNRGPERKALCWFPGQIQLASSAIGFSPSLHLEWQYAGKRNCHCPNST